MGLSQNLLRRKKLLLVCHNKIIPFEGYNMRTILLPLFSLFFTTLASAAGFDFEHKGYLNSLTPAIEYNLNKTASRIDYQAVDMKKLNQYIDSLLKVSKKDFDKWKKPDQLAFLINTYNALTVKRIIEKKVKESIKELGSGFPLFRSAWKIKFFQLFGEESHLDRIEHELTRESGRYQEPRIHFAFNCASIGCPALQAEPFIGKKIDSQLEAATKMFLSDRSRNYFDEKKNTLFVSTIFKWYEGDFEKGHRGIKKLKDFFAKYAGSLTDDPKIMALLKKRGEYEIEYLDYNWNLNNKF